MNAVIIEGAPKASEFQFWTWLSKTVYTGIDRIYGSGGVENLGRLLETVIKLCVRDKTRRLKENPLDGTKYNILVCLDTTSVPRRSSANTKTIKRIIKSYAILDYIKVVKPAYYCFEDCLLLFPDLMNWIYPKNLGGLGNNKRIQKYNNDIQLFDDYLSLGFNRNQRWKLSYTRLSAFMQNKVSKLSATTREQLAAKLLEQLTTGSLFFTNKHELGDCWKAECDTECSLIGTHINFIRAKQCGLFNTKPSSNQKAIDLAHNSKVMGVISNNCPWLLQQST